MQFIVKTAILLLVVGAIVAQEAGDEKCQKLQDELTALTDNPPSNPDANNYVYFIKCHLIDLTGAEQITCSDIMDQSRCEDSIGYCWEGDKCLKPSYKAFKNQKQQTPAVIDFGSFLTSDGIVPEEAQSNNAAPGESGNSGSSERSFGLFPQAPSVGMCIPQPRFPHMCGIRPPLNMKLLEPPIDVPYCRRQPCGGNKGQGNPTACMVNPGCYFDISLYQIRMMYPRIYPGVPTCYSAVNNPTFHKYALNFAQRYGQWKPIYTRCLIQTYRQEMLLEQQRQGGCSMLNSLEYLHYQPKMAGWEGMTEDECLLYVPSSCWHRHYGCVYACRSASMHDVKVRPAKIAPESRTFYTPRQIFGRQQCQVFPKGDQYNMYYSMPDDLFLNAYHRCLAAGCSLDPAAAHTYFYHFRNASTLVPPGYRKHFWDNVYSGACNANNYVSFVNFYQNLPPAQPINPFGFGSSSAFQPIHGTGPMGPGGAPTGMNFPQNFNSVPFSLELGNTGNTETGNTGTSETTSEERTFGFLPPKPQQAFYRPPRCPYVPPPFQLPHIRITKHNMRTCCDRPACFHDNLFDSTEYYSGVTSYYGPPRYGPCSKTCGGGKKTRTRPCTSVNGRPCEGGGVETERCNTHKCPHYGQWGDWGECSATCGGGTQRRRRSCISVGGAQCQPENGVGGIESQSCRTGRCPTIDRDADWGPCVITGNNPSCGTGKQLKVFTCTNPGDYGCPSPPEYKEQRCNKYCGEWKRKGWGDCLSCYKREIIKCLRRDGSEGHCNPADKPHASQQYCCGFGGFGGGSFNYYG